jgi:ornithine cyclodeaminase/alanine dehydrogenase-like protein (mu-crystallin family)
MPSSTILYLDEAAVRAAMPPVETRIELAERTMLALIADAQLPPKLGVDARPAGSFGHAMPAFLRGPAADGTADLLGLKWVVGFPANSAAGLPTIHATVILSDPLTGQPIALLDGAPITADRTAAISGVAIRHWAPELAGRAARVAILGAGVQARSHLPVIGHLLPGAEVAIFDRHPERAEALAAAAGAVAPGLGTALAARDARSATQDADVVITAVSFGEVRQTLTNDHLGPDVLVVAVDYATSVHHSMASEASLFLVDEPGQFLANRAAGLFADYPDPDSTIGLAIRQGVRRPVRGRVLVSHLGVGLADLIFADAIVRNAIGAGRGVQLSR